MHFHIDIKTLQAGISTVIKSLSSRPSMPILEGIYLKATQAGLLLRCSDLTLQIDCLVEADVEEEGDAVLPGRLFSEMCRKLNSETLEIIKEDSTINMKAGRSRMSLQCTEGTEFPDMTGRREAVEIGFPQQHLKDMIRQTSFSTAQDETKPILTGVLFEVDDTKFNMVALDGFRLAMRKAALPAVHERMEAVVPAKSLIEIGRTLQDIDENVVLSFSNTHLALDMGHTKMISRLLEGEYIKYQSILPSEHKTRVRIQRDVLLDSIDRALLLAREGNNNLVRFTIENDTLTVFANSVLGRMEEQIEVDLNGEAIQIAFNARYFADVLKCLNDEEIYMDMNNNVNPCVVKPVQGDAYYYLILPVRIFS